MVRVVRPARTDDLAGLQQMAAISSGGITTLPNDAELLAERIDRSQFAFSVHRDRPKGEAYLFMLDSDKGTIGCSGLLSKTGGHEPLLLYQLESHPFQSAILDVTTAVDSLELRRIYTGPSEVSTLFLHPDHRQAGLGKLLSLSRLLFMALHRHRFEAVVQASLRGILEDGTSPFYEQVGRPFFGVDFGTLSHLRFADPTFVEEISPPTPLYLPLLPPEAVAVIGKIHPNTTAALKILKQQGFTYQQQVDPFDAGPFYACHVDDLTAVRQQRRYSTAAPLTTDSGPDTHLCTNTRFAEFRACLAAVTFDNNQTVRLSKNVMKNLEIEPGEPVCTLFLGDS